MHKKVTVIKEVQWNEEMDGNMLFDAVLKDEHGTVGQVQNCYFYQTSPT